MTEQKKKLLKAKIAAALYHENGKVPTKEEIEKWTKFAQVLYTAVLGESIKFQGRSGGFLE